MSTLSEIEIVRTGATVGCTHIQSEKENIKCAFKRCSQRHIFKYVIRDYFFYEICKTHAVYVILVFHTYFMAMTFVTSQSYFNEERKEIRKG